MKLLGFGNPLMDILLPVSAKFLKNHGIKIGSSTHTSDPNDKIVRALDMTSVIAKIPGGSAQNTVRWAQWVLRDPATCFLGSVGNDHVANQMAVSLYKSRVDNLYEQISSHKTGEWYGMITDRSRTLLSVSGAQTKITPDFVNSEWENIIEHDYFYLEGFTFKHSAEITWRIANHAREEGKKLMLTLSAPIVVRENAEMLKEILSSCSYVFANANEADALSDVLGLGDVTTTIKDLSKRGITLIITQGEKETIVAEHGEIRQRKVAQVPNDLIVDTLGAGDAYAGGIAAGIMRQLPLDEALEIGAHWAKHVLRQNGCQLEGDSEVLI